jgi:hypothetical protein
MLGERLRAARHARFVGRVAEMGLFRSALNAGDLPFHVLYVYGPGGVGKTTLIQEFRLECERQAVPYLYVDARNVEATPDSFYSTLRRLMALDINDSVRQVMGDSPRFVLLVDTYEALAALDDWLREEYLPQLPENVLTVLAGRSAPSHGWRGDPGWQSLMQVIALRNLAPDDSVTYLSHRRVPPDQHAMVLNFTHGHPLALSLVADVFAQQPDLQFQPDNVPHVVQALVGQFVEKTPSPAHRTALEACALVRLMTESLLAEMLLLEDARPIFTWLQSLSFMETGVEGLFPHDLARESLTTDVRWRNPEWYAELHKRARKHYFERFQQTSGALQQRILMDYIYLHRDNPLVQPFYEWRSGGSLFADSLQLGDTDLLVEMVQRHEGSESSRVATHWLMRQPENVLVIRDARRRPLGFVLMLAVDRIAQDELNLDPAVQAVRTYLEQHAPPRLGERVTLFRFWMDREDYQGVSPTQTMIFVNMVRHYLMTPRLAHTFIPCADPDFYLLPFSYADFQRLPEADYVVDEHRYGVYGHDWRIVPPLAWLELLGEREVSSIPSTTPPPPSETVMVLSAREFEDAVHQALRDYTRADALMSSPLLRSKLVMERAGLNADEAKRTSALHDLIREAAESMQRSPREVKFYRALYHTYLQPAPTQELAAELLDVPFSSFRRHLKSGIERLTELLWMQEIGSHERAR